MVQNGFTMLVRNSSTFERLIAAIMPKIELSQTAFIYSQFSGYIDVNHVNFRQSTYDFVHKYDWEIFQIHTSGHASCQALTKVCNWVHPSMAIVPIHKEKGTDFARLKLKSDLRGRIVAQSTKLQKQIDGPTVEVEIEIGE